MTSSEGRPRARTVAARVVLGAAILMAAYVVVGLCLYFLKPLSFPRHRLEGPLFILSFFSAIAVALLGSSAAADEARVRSSTRVLRLCVTLGGAYLLYWPALSVGWLSDDYVMRDWAASHQWVPDTYEFVRPLPLMLWNGVLLVGGAGLFHALLVLLHGLNAFLVGELATLWNMARPGAWIASGLFLVWPTHVEPVVWASGIFDVMATACSLALVILLARPSAPRMQLVAGLPLCAAALFSKESALAIPLILLVAIAPRWMRRRWSLAQIATASLVIVAWSVYAIWRVFVRPPDVGAVLPDVSRHLLKVLVSSAFGGLSVPFTGTTVATMPMIAALFATLSLGFGMVTLAHAMRRTPEHVAAVSGLVWTVLAAMPTLGFLYVDDTLSGSRYLYLPAAGWTLYLSATSTYLIRRTAARLPAIVAIVAIVVMILIAAAQARILMGDWTRAASVRERLVALAIEAISTEGCRTASFRDVPGRVGGAQLFQHGFAAAVADRRPYSTVGPDCSFRWNGSDFIRAQAP